MSPISNKYPFEKSSRSPDPISNKPIQGECRLRTNAELEKTTEASERLHACAVSRGMAAIPSRCHLGA
jgi:hypothetical protein